MVRVHHGKKEAFLEFSTDDVTPSVYVRAKDGRLIAREFLRSFEDAYHWLEKYWRIPVMFMYYSDEEFDHTPVYGNEQIISDEKKIGDFTPQEEVDWLMFNRRRIVYNLIDGRLWVVDCEINYSRDRTLPVLPKHRQIYTSQWSVPQYPDRHYSAFECDLKKAHPGAEIQLEDKTGHFKVARLMGSFHSGIVPVATIQKDPASGLCRVTSFSGEKQKYVFFRSDEGGIEDGWCRTIRELTEKHLEASWKSLFPEEWDVVAFSKKYFFEETFAGHCYQTDNFVGAQSVPKGYAIAWENRFDDILLLRLGSNNTARCPEQYKGQVIGTKGGNIKGIAQGLGLQHWQLKLV